MLSDREKLDAVVWKAKEKEVSYGQFSAMLSETAKKQIYSEYEKYLEGKAKAKEIRMSKAKNRAAKKKRKSI